ncbi:uncharacterized protein EV422DRAFT_502916 [Fimicolochytrium jonesii]|uniref:uncharacterized protein n=1 Tax=Fimicolochytrium jonesii TaxID=1396493 RepID=UPI0022FE58D5|nr:uncharacterized protein EV422DRAFT_502916 [Fimicolochytrium jonesii]KAI8827231.1 hypothetical protein EV422DRAFT_502916 [Fimicolochytrium jonesii]
MQLEDETRHHQLSSLNLPVSNRKLILNKYAPLVFLHPRDRWRPADPAYVFSKSKLDEYNRTVLIPEELWHGNEVAESATVQANIVGQVVQMGPHGKTYLQYWFFYPVNGCQGFRISLWSGLRSFVKERAENFEWCKMAYHNGDWEHITVQLNDTWDGNSEQSIPPIRAVAFSQHAGSEWVYLPDLAFTGTHPHVYSALNSHANYPTEGTHKNRDDTFGFVSRISPLLTLGAVQWIQIADVADLSSDLFLFEEPIGKRFQRFISWMTWTGEVYDWTDKSDWSEWARYSGFWGAEVDQTTILQPPPGVTAARQLHWSTTIAQKLGILNKFVRKHERGPKGPRQHRTWYTLDQPPRNID